MLNSSYIEKKNQLNRKIKKCKNDLELLNTLRTEKARIDLLDDEFILEYDNVKFIINKNSKTITKIIYYSEELKEFKNIQF